MKKAEDFVNRVPPMYREFLYSNSSEARIWFKKLIRKVQEDVIRETVIICAEDAKTGSSTCALSGHIWTSVDQDSILEIADKLIKEL